MDSKQATFSIHLKNKDGQVVAKSLVDEEDFNRINEHKWSLSPFGYAVTSDKRKTIRMHRMIMNCLPSDPMIDHRDRDRLNNRKDNLRHATAKQNAQNRELTTSTKTSKYLGVSLKKDNKTKPWRACSGSVDIGSYKTEEAAAYAYDLFALEEYGEGAKINGVEKPDHFEEWVSSRPTVRYDPDGNELPSGINWDAQQKKYKVSVRAEGPPGTDAKDYRCGKKFTHLHEALTILNQLNTKRDLDWENYRKKRTITRNADGCAVIYAANGDQPVEVMLDDDVWYHASEISWYFRKKDGYIETNTTAANSFRSMSHYVLKQSPPAGKQAHYVNGNKLDNRRANIILTTKSSSQHGKRKAEGTSSIYSGVTYLPESKRWKAGVSKDGKIYDAGQYEDQNMAAYAKKQLAIKLYGDQAKFEEIKTPEGYVFNPATNRVVKGSIDAQTGLHKLELNETGLFPNVYKVSANSYMVKFGPRTFGRFSDVNVANWVRDQYDYEMHKEKASTTGAIQPAGWKFENGEAVQVVVA